MNKILIIVVVAGAVAASQLPAAEAKANWDKHCVKCHAENGSGQTKMGKKLKLKDYRDADVQASFTDEEALRAMKEGIKENGKTQMKPYAKDLSEVEMKDLVAFVRGLKK